MNLTRREIECLRLVADGMTAEQAAAALQISTFTVQDHLKSIRNKLDCTRTVQAVAKAINIIKRKKRKKRKRNDTSPAETV